MNLFSILLIIGIFFIIISGITLGAWTSGDQQRGTFYSETNNHQNFRQNLGLFSGVIGLVILGIAGAIYYFV